MDKVIQIIICIIILLGIISFILNERKNIKEWLLYAVIEAEKLLQGGTGAIKLREVYNMFIITFPFISKLISFTLFSKLVDKSLIEMKKLLNTNIKCRIYVKGIDKNENI